MKRSIRFGMLLVAVFTVFIAVTSRTTAQAPIPNACCDVIFDVAGFPDACFRMIILSRWSCGTMTHVIPGNGTYTFPIGCACPPVPAQFFWATMAGCNNLAWFNFPAICNTNGCCAAIRISRDAAGCIVITIRPVNPPC